MTEKLVFRHRFIASRQVCGTGLGVFRGFSQTCSPEGQENFGFPALFFCLMGVFLPFLDFCSLFLPTTGCENRFQPLSIRTTKTGDHCQKAGNNLEKYERHVFRRNAAPFGQKKNILDWKQDHSIRDIADFLFECGKRTDRQDPLLYKLYTQKHRRYLLRRYIFSL